MPILSGTTMIVGHGDVASVLKDREDRLYFASGVSNSKETRESEYQREALLLAIQERNKHLVYFSSLSIFYSDSRYARHKREMETFVKLNFNPYTIVRMGNIAWGKNPNTLINFIQNKIRRREKFEIQDVYRYVVEKDEFLYWIDMIPPFSCEMNIIGKRLKIIDIVKYYCYPWGKVNDPVECNNSESQLQVCVQNG